MANEKMTKEQALQLIQSGDKSLEALSDELRNDRKVVLAAIKKEGYKLEYASDELRNDREIVLAALSNYGNALEYASDELRNDRELVMAAINNGANLKYASEELRNDIEFVSAAIKEGYVILEYASKELQNNRDIVMAAVEDYGGNLQYASEELRIDREIVLVAVKNSGGALQYASEELRNDREIVLAAVKESVGVLQYASEELRSDREIVMAAIEKDAWAIEYVSEELRSDREIVSKAIKKSGRVLRYASEELKSNREIVLAAIKESGNDVLNYASKSLLEDKEFFNQIFKPFKIVIPTDGLVFAADGPLLFEYVVPNPGAIASGDSDTTIARNHRVEDQQGNTLTPIISELPILQEDYVITFWVTAWKAGYSILNGEIYYEDIDPIDSYSHRSNHNYLGVNKIKQNKGELCSIDELPRFLETAQYPENQENKMMLHQYAHLIKDFQQHYEVSEINKDKMSWDGETLTIHV